MFTLLEFCVLQFVHTTASFITSDDGMLSNASSIVSFGCDSVNETFVWLSLYSSSAAIVSPVHREFRPQILFRNDSNSSRPIRLWSDASSLAVLIPALSKRPPLAGPIPGKSYTVLFSIEFTINDCCLAVLYILISLWLFSKIRLNWLDLCEQVHLDRTAWRDSIEYSVIPLTIVYWIASTFVIISCNFYSFTESWQWRCIDKFYKRKLSGTKQNWY